MSKRHLVAALSLAFALTGGWALAQQFGPGPQTGGKTTTVQGGPAAPAAGRYAVAVSDKTSVLVDTATGKTWVLAQAGDRPVWLPARRLDSDKDVDAWREQERSRFQDRRQRENKEKAQLEDLLQAERDRADALRQKAQQAEAEARRALEEAKRRLQDLDRQRQKKD